MTRFLSADWGTSALRVRLVEATAGEVLGEATSPEGIRRTFDRWEGRGGDRTECYLGPLRELLAALEADLGRPAPAAPLVLSGMASSSIGIAELPYGALPFPLRPESLPCRALPTPLRDGVPVLLVSGLRSADDVMRGEETQLVGARAALGRPVEDALFVLPGTHSKHVRVQADAVTGFRTFMTGELFEVLASNTILRASVADGAPMDPGSFAAGVEAGAARPLPNALFRVRTHTLFGELNPGANRWYLSGVLIGAELAALRGGPALPIHLCADRRFRPLYIAALDALGLADRVRPGVDLDPDRATVLGHAALMRARS